MLYISQPVMLRDAMVVILSILRRTKNFSRFSYEKVIFLLITLQFKRGTAEITTEY